VEWDERIQFTGWTITDIGEFTVLECLRVTSLLLVVAEPGALVLSILLEKS
jgi:hypothetical protein